MKNFTSLKDVDKLEKLIQSGLSLKEHPLEHFSLGKGKTLGLIFFNASLRTRLSTQKAAQNLGMQTLVMNFDNDGWKLEFEDGATMNGNTQEHIKDAVQVLGQYCDIIGIRSFAGLKNLKEDYQEKMLSHFINESKVPIVSLESAIRHPLQSLADLMTINEFKENEKPKVVLSWAPHPKALPQAVANSFAEWALGAGFDLTITHPKGLELSKEFTTGATIEYDQEKALENADFVYVKNWSAFDNYGAIIQDDNWTMTEEKMKLTNNASFMHCLPIRRNVVATDEVIENEKSLVLEQANNRTYAAQAVLKTILENE